MRSPTTWKVTPAQRAALDAVCDTGCHKLAARRLGISVKTIETHMCAIKLNNGLTEPRLLVLLEWDRARRFINQIPKTS